MTATITPRDDTAAITTNGYRYDRVVDIAGRTVRARIERHFHIDYSLAYVEVINDHKSWTHLADAPARDWWDTTPNPRKDIDAAAVLGPVADQLLRRAATILAPTPTTTPTPTPTPRLLDAVGALLVAATDGYDSECLLTPDDMSRARNRGGALHVLDHDDGSVTVTKAHRDDCPFIVSSGAQDCDDDCYFPDSATT